MPHLSAIPDRPISPNEDSLDRDIFARAIADQIISSPEGATLRVGVYGGWGEGKSSVLQLIEHHVRAEGHHCVWLVPWASATRDDLLNTLLDRIADELHLEPRALWIARHVAKKAKEVRSAAKSAWWASLADTLGGDKTEQLLVNYVASQSDAFIKQVQGVIGTKKLVVLVDDLDRVRPQLVPEVLLTLRETLEQPNLFYVLALAPDIVEHGLSMVHEGWGGAKQFLEKIVELPRYLPSPTTEQWHRFIHSQVAKLGASVRAAVIDGLLPLLPQNPRKAKLYLRHLASLHRLVERFDEREVDWDLFYVCQLLLIEFPAETRRVVADAPTLQSIAFSRWTENDKFSGKVDASKQPEVAYAPEDADQRHRFLTLCADIRDRAGIASGIYDLRELLTMAESPPIMTWHEADHLIERYRDGGRPIVGSWLSEHAHQPAAPRRLFHLLLLWRNNLLDGAAEVEAQSELARLLAEASFALRFIADLFSLGATAERSLLGAREWHDLFSHAAKWAHFDRPDYYAAIREEERQLLLSSANVLSEKEQIGILDLEPLVYEPIQTRVVEFVALKKVVLSRFRDTAMRDLLRSLSVPSGLDSFFKGDAGIVRRDLIFDLGLTKDGESSTRDALLSLAASAKTSEAVQLNFLRFLRVLVHHALDGSLDDRSRSRAVLNDAELIHGIWRAIITRPLNPRTTGTLNGVRKEMVAFGIPEELLPLPPWWARLNEEFLEKRDDGVTHNAEAESISEGEAL